MLYKCCSPRPLHGVHMRHTNASIMHAYTVKTFALLQITLHRCCSPRPLHGVHMRHTKDSIMHAFMHSAVARHNDVYTCVNASDPWRRHTSLCLQAELDMITTDEGRRENGGSDTNVVS